MSAERNDQSLIDGAQQTSEPTQPAAPQTETTVANQVSDETGETDARFLLWRQFCDANGVSVDLLPSELDGELRGKWDATKDEVLHQPAENTATPAQTTET